MMGPTSKETVPMYSSIHEMYIRGAKRKTPWRRRRADKMIHETRCARVRLGWTAAGNRAEGFEREWRYRGERRGEPGGDGVVWQLPGSRWFFASIWGKGLDLDDYSLMLSLSLSYVVKRLCDWVIEMRWMCFVSLSPRRRSAVERFEENRRERDREGKGECLLRWREAWSVTCVPSLSFPSLPFCLSFFF